MSNKINSKSKKYLSLALLTAFCSSVPVVLNGKKSEAMIGRIGSAARSLGNSVRRASITSKVSTGSINNISTSKTNLTSNLNRRGSSSSIGSHSVTLNTPKMPTLNERITNLEIAKDLENQRNNHGFNKAIVASGLVSSAALVAGVVGGIIQQSKFTKLAQEQAEKDQKIQQDLTVRRKYFQNKEVPEAEKEIIAYYKKNYGIDISKK